MLTLYRLISFYDTLPLDDTYRAATGAILKNLRQVPDLSIEELSERCWSSPTTLNRLVRRIGCSSFSDFKREIRESIESYDLQTYKMAGSPFLRDPDPAAFFRSMARSLENLSNCISTEALDTICTAIRNHRRISFYADIRDCCINPDKRQLQLDLLSDGKETAFLFDPDSCLQDAQTLDSNCLAIVPCSTYTPSFKHALELMRIAKKQGAAIVAIASQNTPHVSELADYLLEYVEEINTSDGHLVNSILCILALRYCHSAGRRT